jgi:hypothetical protein
MFIPHVYTCRTISSLLLLLFRMARDEHVAPVLLPQVQCRLERGPSSEPSWMVLAPSPQPRSTRQADKKNATLVRMPSVCILESITADIMSTATPPAESRAIKVVACGYNLVFRSVLKP